MVYVALCSITKICILANIPGSCKPHLDWAFKVGKISQPQLYRDMMDVAGVSPLDATLDDFQRYFKCKDVHNTLCNKKGLSFPNDCSYPPCNQCRQGMIHEFK